jgi:hypothetical protein
LCYEVRKGGFELTHIGDALDPNWDVNAARQKFIFSRGIITADGVGRVHERANDRDLRLEVVQKPKTLGRQLRPEKRHASEIAARSIEALNEAGIDRVTAIHEDDRDGCGCSLRRQCGTRAGNDDGRTALDQVGKKGVHAIKLVAGVSVIDRHILTSDKSRLLQALLKPGDRTQIKIRRPNTEEPDQRQGRPLLRPRRRRPRRRRAAEEGERHKFASRNFF